MAILRYFSQLFTSFSYIIADIRAYRDNASTASLSKHMGCLKLISGPLTRAQLDQCYNIVYAPVAPVAGSTPPPLARLGAGSASSSTAAP